MPLFFLTTLITCIYFISKINEYNVIYHHKKTLDITIIVFAIGIKCANIARANNNARVSESVIN